MLAPTISVRFTHRQKNGGSVRKVCFWRAFLKFKVGGAGRRIIESGRGRWVELVTEATPTKCNSGDSSGNPPVTQVATPLIMQNFKVYIYAFNGRIYPKLLTIASMLYIFHQYVCSLGIEPTSFCAANAMLYHWATQEYKWMSFNCPPPPPPQLSWSAKFAI